MNKLNYFKDWKKITTVSFGLVYIFFNLWVIFHVPDFVPVQQQSLWFRIFISYGVLNSIIFANADLRNKLFNVKFTKFLPRFAIFFFSFLFIFYFVLNWADPTGSSFMGVLSNVPLWLAVIHALTFATTETVIWQGFLDEKIGHPWSELTAGIFHLFVWTGSAVVVIITASMLFAFFSLVNLYFRNSKNDLAPAIGCHTAFNIVKVGLMAGAVVGL